MTSDGEGSGMASAIGAAASVVLKGDFFSERYYGTFLPWYYRSVERLELQEWKVYQSAVEACTKDSIRALKSTYRLWYLLLRPFAILFWIGLEHFVRFLMEHGGRSLQTLAIQTKNLAIGFYRFQLSLNQTQVLGEVGLVAILVGLYYLRKWLLRQTYWARFVAWHQAKKQKVVRSYTQFVHKVARVSKLLAMALPHSLFLILGIGMKIAFPQAVRWVTYETPLLPILSLWYPFLSTFSWVVWVQRGEEQKSAEENSKVVEADASKPNTNNEELASTTKKPSSVSTLKSRFENNANEEIPQFITETRLLSTTRYWLQYWQIYAIVQAVGKCISMIPFVGRFLSTHRVFHFVSGEFKLFLFVWIFGMEKLLGGNAEESTLMKEALPLRLIQKYVTPLVLQTHDLVSDAIPKDVWQKWVVSKSKTTLDVFVLVRMLSEERRNWLVHIAEEARVLTLPSITLLMPGFVTQFGVAYVRYIVPSAKSSQASSKSKRIVYLQYWILHCCVSGLLSQLEGVLWWIPFSAHLVFLLWSYLILPQAIQHWYGILESDLMVFGIIPKTKDRSDDDIHQTKIARLFLWIVSWLPSADTSSSSLSMGDAQSGTVLETKNPTKTEDGNEDVKFLDDKDKDV